MDFVSKDDIAAWEKKHQNFEDLLKNEFNTIFTDPHRLNKLLELQQEALTNTLEGNAA
jgi:hypothetical protein